MNTELLLAGKWERNASGIGAAKSMEQGFCGGDIVQAGAGEVRNGDRSIIECVFDCRINLDLD